MAAGRASLLVPFAAGVAVTLGAITLVPLLGVTAAPGPEETTFVPVTPCRLFDFRGGSNQVGPKGTPLGPNASHAQAVRGNQGNCSVPSHATGVSMNVTVLNGTGRSFLTVYPADAERPLASNLNWVAGQPATPNKVDVKLSATGAIRLYNAVGNVDVFADVVGYYTPQGLSSLQTQIDALSTQLANVQSQVTTANSRRPRVFSASGDDSRSFNNTSAHTLRSVLVIAPANGRVVVNASAFAYSGASGTTVFCGITVNSTSLDPAHMNLWTSQAPANEVHLGATRVVNVTPGNHVFRFVCGRTILGTQASYTIGDTSVNAVFIAD